MIKIVFAAVVSGLFFTACNTPEHEIAGQSEITKWPDNKRSAISITYDDGIINQLTVARPIMNKLGLPGTFFIITGKVEGSGEGKFIGRSPDEIIAETAAIPTDSINFFERASLIAFTGTTEAVDYHSRAGSLFEQGRVDEAYALIDEGYEKIRNGVMKNTNDVVFHDNAEDTTTWEQYRNYAAEGHEIASHTVTHARLAVLDEPNLLYELEQSKKDIASNLGEEYTFSVECPYGTENERVMEYAYEIYPALRNRMPAPYLEELNRSSREQPGEFDKEYVQWQRGPLTDVSMDVMKSWVDTCMANDNIWLVLVFHGINGIGWEPKTDEDLEEYFSYIAARQDDLWVATFGDVTKYIRERMNSKISTDVDTEGINVNISTDLDAEVYDIPLTVKTYVPGDWTSVIFDSGEDSLELEVKSDEAGSFVLYEALPARGTLVLKEG